VELGGREMLAVEEVASLCGLSRKAIYRAIERGELRATKRCSRWRIWREDLVAWLEDGINEPATPATEPRRARRSAPRPLRGSFRQLLESEGI
jgi:excisionase family DNA binding protein